MPGKTEAIAADLRVSAKTRLDCRVPCETEAIAGDPRVSAKTMLNLQLHALQNRGCLEFLIFQSEGGGELVSLASRCPLTPATVARFTPGKTQHRAHPHSRLESQERASPAPAALNSQTPECSAAGWPGGQQFQPRNMRRWLQGPCSA